MQEYGYQLPFTGPSLLRFNASAGTTYYFAVDTKSSTTSDYLAETYGFSTGPVTLNWAFHPSGVFRFATEEFDMANWQGAVPAPLFQCSEWESEPDWEPTHDTYYVFDPAGVLVTVTRVAGSSGRMLVDYTTQDLTNSPPRNSAVALAGTDYSPVSGTLVFDDFEMSKTLVIPIIPPGFSINGSSKTVDRDFAVVLSNPRPDPAESPDVSPPRLDTPLATATVRILSLTNPQFDSNQYTNSSGSPPTHDVYNFVHKNFRVPRDVNNFWTTIPISVERTLKLTIPTANDNGATINYRINATLQDDVSPQDWNNFFDLNPGSDYAMPNPDQACPWIFPWAGTNLATFTNFDYTLADGTVTVPAVGYGIINFTVNQDQLTKFNKDFNIVIWRDVDSDSRERWRGQRMQGHYPVR